jgi:hypothetical protein
MWPSGRAKAKPVEGVATLTLDGCIPGLQVYVGAAPRPVN